jgi:hypothetical protein
MALNNLRHSDTSGLCILMVLLASYERGEPPCTTEVQYALYDEVQYALYDADVRSRLRKSFNRPYLSLSNPPIWKIQIIGRSGRSVVQSFGSFWSFGSFSRSGRSVVRVVRVVQSFGPFGSFSRSVVRVVQSFSRSGRSVVRSFGSFVRAKPSSQYKHAVCAMRYTQQQQQQQRQQQISHRHPFIAL